MSNENLPLPSSPSEIYLYNIANSLFDYFQSEVFTGSYWVDGKKIYCKVFFGTTTNRTSNYDNLVIGIIPPNSNLVDCKYTIFTNDNKYSTNNNRTYLILIDKPTGNVLNYIYNENYVSRPIKIIFKYTKQ